LNANLKEGIISAIDFIDNPDEYQLGGTVWKDIPMFSILTGLNGIGKSSILRYIKRCSGRVVNEIFTTKQKKFADLNRNNRKITFTTSCRVKTLLVDHNEAIDDDKNALKQLITQTADESKDSKISIMKLIDTKIMLEILKNDLDDLSAFVTKKKFKYTRILHNIDFKLSIDENNNSQIRISDLSPGENLIFRLLIWQYIFNDKKFRPAEKCVMLFDEPDSHLHPSAVKDLIDNLKDLCSLGVQIFLTTHNPTTVSFIEKENLFLLEKQGDKLSVRKGLSATEIFHKLTSRLVNIEAPSRKIFVEGNDSAFYEVIHKFLIDSSLVESHFQLNFMPLPGGGDNFRRNRSTIIGFMQNIEPDNKNPVYDSIHSFYGIIDDDNDRLRVNTQQKYLDIMNLFVLKRYAKENYVLDPINIYFYLTSLTDEDGGQNKNIKILLKKIYIQKGLKLFSLKEIYQELQKPMKSEETAKAMTTFLQTIVDTVGKIVFDIIFKTEKAFSKFKLTKTNTKLDSEHYDFLKPFLVDEKITVSVFGIELKYPNFFTCIQGHFLEELLNHRDIFGGNVVCDKIITKFKQTGTGMFIPDEIINIYRTICHNIIYLDEANFVKFVTEKYINKNWFILYNSNDCEELKR